jgi:hypothetical protein
MSFKVRPGKEPEFLFRLSLLSFLELFISGVMTLLISPDPKNVLILGFSLQRLLLVAGIWVVTILVLTVGVIARKKKLSLDSAWLVDKNKYLRAIIYAISFMLILWGWISVFCPGYLFGRLVFIFERLQPISIALGLSFAQSWIFFLFAKGRLGFRTPLKYAFQKYYRPFLIFTGVMIVLGIFIATTKFGLVGNLVFWNVAGIPLTGLQLLFILLLAGLWIAFVPIREQEHRFWKVVAKFQLIPVLIFISAVLAWGLTPMTSQFFSLGPAAPGFQPFPFSDARFHDVGGISILKGYGIYFFGYTDKPLTMVFMAVLHFFAGYNYSLMTWLQILVLALIPVVLYFLGKKFHSAVFGIFLSLVMIIRQSNAIILSNRINSVNPKLFMSEELTLLGVVLFCYLVFLWIRERKTWQALLCGACLGAASLLRLNPLFLFPAAVCVVVPAFWSLGKKFIFKHLSVYILGFMVLFVPWVITGVNPQGTPWLLIKLENVIQTRFGGIHSPARESLTFRLPLLGMEAAGLQGNAAFNLQEGNFHALINGEFDQALSLQNIPATLASGMINPDGVVLRFLDHLLHNFSTSLLSMPDSLRYDDLNHLSQQPYWDEGKAEWLGDLPVAQTGLVVLNILLIALGLGYSWVHHRWAGMLPMAVFLAYSLGVAAAMNSGGRYIVPMDWVLYFYYGLAVLAMIQFVHKVISGRDSELSANHVLQPSPRTTDRRSMVFSLVGVVILASLVPMANLVLPALPANLAVRAQVEAARNGISADEAPGKTILSGIILYPYNNNDGTLSFDFLTPLAKRSYIIDIRTTPLKEKLLGGEDAFIALGADALGNPQVESIYLWEGGAPVLLWKFQP